MDIIKKIVHILSIITYIGISIYIIICIPMVFGYKPVVVLSGSMEPTFQKGDVIYYHKVLEKDLKEQDIITFYINKLYVSHRIIKIENGQIQTKGDANNIADIQKIQYENIKGKVGSIKVPNIGYYILFINQNLIIVVITCIIILVSEFLLSNTETFDINNKIGRREKK